MRKTTADAIISELERGPQTIRSLMISCNTNAPGQRINDTLRPRGFEIETEWIRRKGKAPFKRYHLVSRPELSEKC